MKSRFRAILLALCCGSLAGIAAGFLTSSGNKEAPPSVIKAETVRKEPAPNNFEEPVITETEASETDRYMVSLGDNKLYIYKISPGGSMQIVEEKTVNTDCLRRDDFEALNKGIEVSSLTEARELAEDYVN